MHYNQTGAFFSVGCSSSSITFSSLTGTQYAEFDSTLLHNSIITFCKAVTILSSLSNLSSTVHLLSTLPELRVDLFVNNGRVKNSGGEDSGIKSSGGDNDENIGKTPWDHDQNTEEKDRGSDGDNSAREKVEVTTVLIRFVGGGEVIFVP